MDVKFISTTSEKLPLLPIQEGQIIALSDADGYYYDMGTERRPVNTVEYYSELPSTGRSGILYIIESDGKNKVYMWTGSEFFLISATSQVVNMTWAEYEALPEADKMNGNQYYITDMESTTLIDDTQSSGSMTYSSLKIENIISGLAQPTVGGSGRYITSVSQTGGKLSAQSGIIDSMIKADSDNLITSGAVYSSIDSIRSSIPTSTSEIRNDSGFITATVSDLVNYYTKSQTYTQEEINSKISEIPKFSIQVVNELPTQDISNTTVYLLRWDSPESQNLYTEYIHVGEQWEKLGEQSVDLSGYYTSGQVDQLLSEKANTSLLANVATSGSYDDLSNKPEIPQVTDTFSGSSHTAMSGVAVASALSSYQPDWSNIENKPFTNIDNATIVSQDGTLKVTGFVSDVKLGGSSVLSDGVANLPEYPTSLPASDVSDWAKAPNKPGYTATEVGALPEGTFIPKSLSDMLDDTTHRVVTDNQISSWNNKLSSFTESDPTVPSWAKEPNKPTYIASEVGAATLSDIQTEIKKLDCAQIGGTGKYITSVSQVDGVISATSKSADTSVTQGSSNLVTSGAVFTAIDNLPEPMVFKGSLGTNGTISSLPDPSSANTGFTYKVITKGTYQGTSAKVGDTFISTGTDWTIIPSGDEPSGTVTSVAVQNDDNGGLSVSGSPVTTSGTVKIKHSNILAQAGSAGSSKATSGLSIDIPYVNYDINGHVTSSGVHKHTVSGNASTTKSGLMSSSDKAKLDQISENATATSVSQILTSGIKSATITIDGNNVDIYSYNYKFGTAYNAASNKAASMNDLTASNTSYNNSSSHLSADTVQKAIDEIVGGLSDIATINVVRNIVVSSGQSSVTIQHSKITESSLIEVFYRDPNAAIKCNPSYQASVGTLTITFENAPQADLTIDGITII